jgi:transposase
VCHPLEVKGACHEAYDYWIGFGKASVSGAHGRYVYGRDRAGGVKAQPSIAVFVNREPAVIAMEACGSAQHWARELVKLGHEVRLIAAQFVRPY